MCVCVCVCVHVLEGRHPQMRTANPVEFQSEVRRQSRQTHTTARSRQGHLLGCGSNPIMYFRLCLVLAIIIGVSEGQKRRPTTDEWDYKDGSDKVSMKGVANLTQVLDNWRYDILTQMKNMLQNDHKSLLPDYARIEPLSEALNDLYKEFNALKERLGELSEKFTPIETFIEESKKTQVPKKKTIIPKKKTTA
ncbi:uncharacterized protein si:ch211-76l23.4 [Polypterus senegalus]|uniref:uncharacterized protein si:ch211-76l23.4 n=1 Tax=Polypterus senegalus TaxID=55291 RepID=UPI001964419A|nr:uncharacterized protein si:ch211-76l23.4 [Polypterus senegalus]